MSLCSTVSILVSEIEPKLESQSPSHADMLKVLKRMPDYFKKGDLAEWEKDYRNAIHPEENESSEVYKTIELLYELASHNLFGAYQAEQTRKLYLHVASQLSDKGFIVSKNLNVDQW